MSGATCATCRHFRTRLGGPRGDCFRFLPREGDIPITYPNETGCGEHAPTPAVGVPGLPSPWRFRATSDDTTYASDPTTSGWCGVSEHGLVSASSAPPDVVIALIAAHRAGGAS